ncbi:DUF5684 domain-containing protein [Umezawaea sp. Da 62-37]|uniref:DUF5684 domain-containing protein n=1 Tax=Umezawaea sp. Da 62-37 TaxID=3075927 RepID=UPI0028F71D99|nr:DUF5684 domain-containing protein [Umezawaea sp. Da 62-37]WNV90558.1 DUF5684 domain-containing protein [Umezawaea sp. Da 62-37]
MNYDNTGFDSSVLVFPAVVGGIFGVLAIVALWKIFTKAGKPGWAAIIPIYNIYTMLKVAGRPGWWLIWYIIPFVNIVVSIIVALDLAKSFGKSGVFGFFGLWVFNIIGYLMLAFGNSTYQGPAAARA